MDLLPRAFYLGCMDELEEILPHNDVKENTCKPSQATPFLNMSFNKSSSFKPSQATHSLNMSSNESSSCMFETLKEHTSMETIALQAIHNMCTAETTCYVAALFYIFEKDGLKLTSKFDQGTTHPLPEWYPERPLSSLIDFLFRPQLRTSLECVQILAGHTQSLDQVALGYILNGEITSLAALLLVTPFTSGMLDTLKRHTSMESIGLQGIHSPRAAEATCYAAALLYIFEKDGHKLTSEFDEIKDTCFARR